MKKSILNKAMKMLQWALLLSPFVLFFIICMDTYTIVNAEGRTYNSTYTIPYNKVGLLLGTSKYLNNGTINPYYQFRLDAATDLYKSGKVKYILISGDNSRKDYNEPATFKRDLIERGIPKASIFLDYAGFRTLDSIIRAKEVFGLENFTLISQKFHNYRALLIADHFNLNVIGYNAETVTGTYAQQTQTREYLARVKALLDIAVNKQPKFLGDKIKVE